MRIATLVLSMLSLGYSFSGRFAMRTPSRSLAMATKVPDVVPSVTFKARVRDEKIGGTNPFTWKDVTTIDLFKGKRVVLFSLPGAFTPTCSSTHLPGYEKNYEAIKALGIDEVYCLSVNDAFVMRQWGLHQGLPEEKTSTANPFNPGNFQKVITIVEEFLLLH